MRYVGSITDEHWTRAVLRLDPIIRKGYMNKMLENRSNDEDFEFIFSLNRLPRIYLDEHTTKENK
jgi:hypothetical protein